MSKKRKVFELLDRDCVNSLTADYVKKYIENLLVNNTADSSKRKNDK